MSLKTERGSWMSFWDSDQTSVRLAVRGLSSDSGFYSIGLEHRTRMLDIKAQQKTHEEHNF